MNERSFDYIKYYTIPTGEYMQTEEQHRQRKIEIMEKCYECYAEHGLTGTGIQMLAEACGCTKSNLYSYFKNLDELIIESTAY